MSSELTKREPTTLEIIGQIANSPNFGTAQMDVLERMIALKERTDAQERKNAYVAAMTALQAELPQIDKRGRIFNKDGSPTKAATVRSTYARIEDLDAQIRPYLAKHGFGFSYDTRPADKPSEIRFIGTMSHSAGHSEEKQIDMPIETGAMSDQQKRGSTLSHGIRMLLRMFLNLVFRDEDDDGTGTPEIVTAKDLATIKELLAKIGGEGNEAKLLEWMKVKTFEDIQRRDVQRALSFLRAKATEKASK